MFSGSRQNRLGVAVKLFFGVGDVNQRNHGKHHSLISCRQIIQKFPELASLLLHIIRNDGRKILIGVLPPLPVGNIRFNP